MKPRVTKMSERTTERESMDRADRAINSTSYLRLLSAYKEIYVLLAEAEQRAVKTMSLGTYVTAVESALEKMEKSGYIDFIDFTGMSR